MDTTSRAPDSSFATITFDPCVFSVLSHMLESMRKFLDAIVLSDMVCPKLTPDTRKENNSLLLSRTLREASRRSERVKPADKFVFIHHIDIKKSTIFPCTIIVYCCRYDVVYCKIIKSSAITINRFVVCDCCVSYEMHVAAGFHVHNTT